MAAWYTDGMEVQIMAAADKGEPVAGKRNTWSDGITEWGHIRLPKNADTEPVDNDYEMRWPLHEHVDYIGMTGWCYKNKRSIRVGFDFDSIMGHANGVGVTDDELLRVRAAVEKIPQAWLFYSTGGSGLHLYLPFDPDNAPETVNHHEHAALARSCLGVLSNLVNYPFEAALDVCGGNMWIWGRKMTSDNHGLSLIKKGEGFFEPPLHWRDHISVVTRKRTKIQIHGVPDGEETDVENMAASRRLIPLDATHRKIIEELQTLNYSTYWVDDHNMLQTHTCALKEVFKRFAERGDPLHGQYDTLSDGTDPGKPNCFAFACLDGVFKVIRYGENKSTEHVTWSKDNKGRAYCYFNQKLDLNIAATIFGGMENASRGGGYTFPTAEEALGAIKSLGSSFDIPAQLVGKPTTLRTHKDGRVVVEIKAKTDDPVPGFIQERGKFVKLLNVQARPTAEDDEKVEKFDLETLDQMVRALLTVNLDEAGWALYDSEFNHWTRQTKDNIRSALKAKNFDSDATEKIMGHSVMKAWSLVNIPFADEQPGNRQWNINAAQFRFAPTPYPDDMTSMHPHWDLILEHCGEDLTQALKHSEWARKNSVSTGKDYLLYWIASMFRNPFDRLPYLFFFGPQNSGKSIFHEAIALLVKDEVGVQPADQALTNPNGFNGELANTFLCVVEETNLSKEKSAAYNRIKEWTMALMMSIHPKRMQVYKQRNTTHWIQCANERTYCPIFPGDTRITMSYVGPLEREIPKDQLIKLLEAEAPYFMATILSIKLPEADGRAKIPALMTGSKEQAASANRNPLEAYLEDICHHSPGSFMSFNEFIEHFMDSLPSVDRPQWNERRILQELPNQYPSGHYKKDNKIYIGNVSFTKPEDSLTHKFIFENGQLERVLL